MKKSSIYRKNILLLSIFVLLFVVQSAWSQNQDWQERPIQLGTSGGNINDMSKVYCCGGTLGALVNDNINSLQYILSNNHVLARTNKGVKGEDIIQPGLIDQNPGCYKDSSDVVADLSKFVPISFERRTTNKVDAAVAAIRSGAVDPSGSILGIGQVSNQKAAPAINMSVQKSGRTTGLTTGTVTAVNVTVDVTYDKACGIGSQKARFINQIMIGPAGFSKGGDSGSLIVENCSPSPRAVGLLFAGSDTVTVANPISDVLTSLGVSMAGAAGYCESSEVTDTSATTERPRRPRLPPQANQRAIEAVSKVKERHEEAILSIEGVVGMGVGLSETVPGEVVIEVYVKKPKHEMKRVIPEVLEGVPVKTVETGEIIAY